MKAKRSSQGPSLILILALAALSLSVERLTTQAAPAVQASLTDLSQVQSACDRFIQAVSKSETNAFDFIEDHWMVRDNAAKIASDTARRWTGAEPIFKLNAGRRLSGVVDFLGTRRLGTNMVKLVYLLHYEQGFLPWSLTFYRPGTEWGLTQFMFGDGVKDDLVPMERALKEVPRAIQDVIHPSMESLSQGEWSRALRPLRNVWYKPDEATGTFAEFERRARSADDLIETDLGDRLARRQEFVGARALGNHVVYCIYLIRHERGVIPWLLVFYQATDEWKLMGFTSGSGIPDGMLGRFAESENANVTPPLLPASP